MKIQRLDSSIDFQGEIEKDFSDEEWKKFSDYLLQMEQYSPKETWDGHIKLLKKKYNIMTS